MKYLKVFIGPIKIKGDVDDEETLVVDLREKLLAMIESDALEEGKLKFEYDEDDAEDEDY